VCGVPAASLFYKATAFDIFLPRLLAGEKISADEVAAYSIGGCVNFVKFASTLFAFGNLYVRSKHRKS